jgi:hypothetical protein
VLTLDATRPADEVAGVIAEAWLKDQENRARMPVG